MAKAVLVRVQSWAPRGTCRFPDTTEKKNSENLLRREAEDPTYTEVAELVDAHVSGACAARREGSSPSFGTKRLS